MSYEKLASKLAAGGSRSDAAQNVGAKTPVKRVAIRKKYYSPGGTLPNKYNQIA